MLMKPTARRAIALISTCIFMLFYVFFALATGNLFENKPSLVKFLFFAIAGIIWVFPLYPLFKWMRVRPGEIEEKETAPLVSRVKK
ncbi:MAG: DUF2842 domain-containing protein [Pseudomonadota bacterium]